MLCKNCNKEIENTSIYCPECGIKTELNETVQINQATTIQPKSAVINQIATITKKKTSKEMVILIAVIAFWIVFGIIFVIACAVDNEDSSSPFGEYSEEEVVKTLTISTIRDQYSISHDQDVYDIEILDTDDHYNYIVSATTESKQGFETWWFLLLKFDTDSGNYQTYIHWHGEDDFNGEIDGGRFTKNNIPDYYRTNNKFGWGEENHIEIE